MTKDMGPCEVCKDAWMRILKLDHLIGDLMSHRAELETTLRQHQDQDHSLPAARLMLDQL